MTTRRAEVAHWMWADSVARSSQLLSVLVCGLSRALLKREALSDCLVACCLVEIMVTQPLCK